MHPLLTASLALLCLAAPAGAATYDFTATDLMASVGSPPAEWLAPISGTFTFTPGGAPDLVDYTGSQWIDWAATLMLSNGVSHSGVAIMVTYIDSAMVRYAINAGGTNILLDTYYGAFAFSAWNNPAEGEALWEVNTPWLHGAWSERTTPTAVPDVAATAPCLLAALGLCLGLHRRLRA